MYVSLFLVAAVVATRLLPLAGDAAGLAFVANMCPLLALTLCGGVFFRPKWLAVLPLVGFVVSDAILNVSYGQGLIGWHSVFAFGVYALLALAGWMLGKRGGSTPAILGTTCVGVIVFYLVTNTGSFFLNPVYAKTLNGWLQCMTVGVPGFPPTWTFLVKSLISNIVFAGIFCVVFNARTERLKQSDSSDLATSARPVA